MGTWRTASGEQVSGEDLAGADLRALTEAQRARDARRRAEAVAVPPADAERRQNIERQARRELLLSYLREPLVQGAGALVVLVLLALLVL